MCAEIAGDIYLGDSRQPTCKNLLPFDLVSYLDLSFYGMRTRAQQREL